MKTMQQKLINDLLDGYNKDAHPIPLRQNKSLHRVTFGLELVQLVNVVSIDDMQRKVYFLLQTPSGKI